MWSPPPTGSSATSTAGSSRTGRGRRRSTRWSPTAWRIYGKLCAWTLARAHARSGDRVAIAAYLGKGPVFDRAILEFSDAYAQQNERDYQALRAAVDSGQIIAQTGV